MRAWQRARLAPMAVGVGLLLAAGQAAAAAGPTVQSGWWNEAAVGPVTAPSASAGQLQVSN
ncbi:MAG TPA: hypothetical protein VFH58_14870, partial [Acidimicrobiales bacterium]|nr:hypothetical protein [Acidimicrobiales bacterium]